MNVVALSGGWKSAVRLLQIISNGVKCDMAVTVDYGDNPHAVAYATKLCKEKGVEHTVIERRRNDCYPNYRDDFNAQGLIRAAEWANKHLDSPMVHTGYTVYEVGAIKRNWPAPWPLPRIIPSRPAEFLASWLGDSGVVGEIEGSQTGVNTPPKWDKALNGPVWQRAEAFKAAEVEDVEGYRR